MDDELVDTVVADRYRALRRLGAGAMSWTPVMLPAVPDERSGSRSS